jgi:hypothetical protein
LTLVEKWKVVPGYPRYEASSLGRIRLLKTGRLLSINLGSTAYPRVVTFPGRRCVHVHRMVAAAFYGDHPGLTVNHKDGVKNNNRVENLEWVTVGENHRHSFVTGLRTKHNTSKLTKVDRDMIRQWHATGEFSINAIARAFNVTKRAITYALTKEHHIFKEQT